MRLPHPGEIWHLPRYNELFIIVDTAFDDNRDKQVYYETEHGLCRGYFLDWFLGEMEYIGGIE